MRWFPATFLTGGVLIAKRAGFKLATLTPCVHARNRYATAPFMFHTDMNDFLYIWGLKMLTTVFVLKGTQYEGLVEVSK